MFDCFQYFAPTWMHNYPVEVCQFQVMTGKKMIHRWPQLIARASRNVRTQDDAEAVIFNRPTHHRLGSPPHVLARSDQVWQDLTVKFGPQKQCSGAITKQRRGDEILDATVSIATIDCAQFNDEEKHDAVAKGPRQTSSVPKARYATSTAKAENR